jgi:fibronectin type 3 domain-containing protein
MAPPAAPTGLAATAGDGSVALQWSPAAGAANYNVYAASTSGAELALPPIASTTDSSINLTGLGNGQIYYFVVAAGNVGGQSGPSNEVSATPLARPGAVGSVVANAGSAQIALNWQSAPGATGYDVYEGTAAGAEGATPVMTVTSATSATLTGLTNGREYFMTVVGRNASGTGPISIEVNATPVAAPTLSATPGGAQVTLSWSATSGAYAIYEGTASGAEGAQPVITVTNQLSATVTGLSNGTRYYFTATATNASGASSPSSEVSATPVAGGGGGGGAIDSMSIIALLGFGAHRVRRLLRNRGSVGVLGFPDS